MSIAKPSTFYHCLQQHNLTILRNQLDTIQVNVGKRCNQACHHCHVDAGPKRTEIMRKKTIDRILTLLKDDKIVHTVDITGGAPELCPDFRYFVTQLRRLNKTVIDRCNLTVLLLPEQADCAAFLANNQVQIFASLPCYTADNVDNQRGRGVFQKSMQALQALNDLGYGKPSSKLILNLIYNPQGPSLPGAQKTLQADYKTYLKKNYGITFNQLLTITNMPINRFKTALVRDGKLNDYMEMLQNNFNPSNANKVMCSNLLSIDWQGNLYDCDFNQMLDIPLHWHKTSIWDIEDLQSLNKKIAFADHCYACMAGAGSSCSGALT